MTKKTTLLLSLVLAIGLSFIVHEDLVSQFLPQQTILALNEDENIEGIPEAIQGVWEYQDSNGRYQLVLRGDTMIMTNPSGTYFYEGIQSQVEANGQNDTTEYTLNWDVERFNNRYSDESINHISPSYQLTYQADEDTLYGSIGSVYTRNLNAEWSTIIRDNLTQNQPINAETLRRVDNQSLIDYYAEAQQVLDEDDEAIWYQVYFMIADDYPALDLLTRQTYHDYLNLAETIATQENIPLYQLNKANPQKVLDWYEAVDGTSDEEKIATILPAIEQVRLDYANRQETYIFSLKTISDPKEIWTGAINSLN